MNWELQERMEDRIIAYFKQHKNATRRQAMTDIGCTRNQIRMVLDGKVESTTSSAVLIRIQLAKRNLMLENNALDQTRLRKVTTGKQPPKHCLIYAIGGRKCASIDPVKGATHCAECDSRFDTHSFAGAYTNYRPTTDYR